MLESIRQQLMYAVPEAVEWREAQGTLSYTTAPLNAHEAIFGFLENLDLFGPETRKVLEIVLPYAQASEKWGILASSVAKDVAEIVEAAWPFASTLDRSNALISAASNPDSGVLKWALARESFSQNTLSDALATAAEVGRALWEILPLCLAV